MRHDKSVVLSVAAVAAVAGVLGGCSSSTAGQGTTTSAAKSASTAAGSSSSSAAAPSSTAPSSSAPSGSASALDSVLLRAGDLPAGWTPGTHDSSGDDDSDNSVDKQLSRCIGVSVPAGAESDAGTVHSPDFKSGNNEIGSQAKPARDVAAQKRFNRTVVASSKTDGCFETLVRKEIAKSLPAGAKVGTVKVHVGGRAAGQPANVQINFTARIQLTVQGHTIATVLDFVDILGTKVDAEIDFQGIGAPIPASTQRSAVAAVAGRVAQAR